MSFNPGGGGVQNANDVAFNNPKNNQTISFNSGLGKWVNHNSVRTLSVYDYGAVGNGIADDRAAIQAAIDAANSLGAEYSVVVLGPRHAIGSPGLSITKQLALVGNSRSSTTLLHHGSYRDAIITLDHTATNLGEEGVVLKNFRIIADRSMSGRPIGIVTANRVDELLIEDVQFIGLKGGALLLGIDGEVRQSYFNRVLLRGCGDGNSWPSLLITQKSTDYTGANPDGSNQLSFCDLEVNHCYGPLVIRGPNPSKPTRGLIFHGRTQLHGLGVPDTDVATADLCRIEGYVQGVIFDHLTAVASGPGTDGNGIPLYSVLRTVSDSAGTPGTLWIGAASISNCAGDVFAFESISNFYLGGALGTPVTGAYVRVYPGSGLVAYMINAFGNTGDSSKFVFPDIATSGKGTLMFGNKLIPPTDFLFGDGGSGSPSISFYSDSDTGIFHVGADNMGFTAGGSNKARVSTDGLTMHSDIVFGNGGGKIGSAAGQEIGFWGKTPIQRPSSTPAAATDTASAISLVNDLRAKLINMGLIS